MSVFSHQGSLGRGTLALIRLTALDGCLDNREGIPSGSARARVPPFTSRHTSVSGPSVPQGFTLRGCTEPTGDAIPETSPPASERLCKAPALGLSRTGSPSAPPPTLGPLLCLSSPRETLAGPPARLRKCPWDSQGWAATARALGALPSPATAGWLWGTLGPSKSHWGGEVRPGLPPGNLEKKHRGSGSVTFSWCEPDLPPGQRRSNCSSSGRGSKRGLGADSRPELQGNRAARPGQTSTLGKSGQRQDHRGRNGLGAHGEAQWSP